MTRPTVLCAAVAAALGFSALPGRAQLAGPLNFDAPGQLGANFRTLLAPGTGSVTDTAGYVAVDGPQTAWIGAFDTTPSDSTPATQDTFAGAIKIHIDISAANANASFGIFLFDATTATSPGTNNILALLNLDSSVVSPNTEQIRFWHDTITSGTAVTNQYITGISGTNGSFSSNSWVSTAATQDFDISAPFQFLSLDFTYDPTAGTLLVATPNFSATLAIPGADIITNPGIALRINDPGTVGDTGTQKFDNFTVTNVPEPTAATLLLAGLGLGARRRRRA